MIRGLIQHITSSSSSAASNAFEEFSLATLCGLSPFLWRGLLLAPTEKDSFDRLSRPGFVELAADKWLRSHHTDPDQSSKILYHLLNVMLHTNLLLVQKLAHMLGSEANLDKERQACQTSVLHWVQSRHYQVAHWHAERILQCAEKATGDDESEIMVSGQRSRKSFSTKASEASKVTIDVAHVPYAIYYATLVLWCAASAGDEIGQFKRVSSIARGRSLLSRLRLRIAGLLEHVLRQVERKG